MTTIAWSPRVGQMWRARAGGDFVEVTGDHFHAGLVCVLHNQKRLEWMPLDQLQALYEPACCESCGTALTRKMVDALPEPMGGQG